MPCVYVQHYGGPLKSSEDFPYAVQHCNASCSRYGFSCNHKSNDHVLSSEKNYPMDLFHPIYFGVYKTPKNN